MATYRYLEGRLGDWADELWRPRSANAEPHAAKASTCSRKSGLDNCGARTALLSGEGGPKIACAKLIEVNSLNVSAGQYRPLTSSSLTWSPSHMGYRRFR
jgi:hypothetical protein